MTRLDDIRARASVETIGFFATADGQELPLQERVPQIVTYFREIPMIATSPATLVERSDVLWLCDRHAELVAACETMLAGADDGNPFAAGMIVAAVAMMQAAVAKAHEEEMPS